MPPTRFPSLVLWTFPNSEMKIARLTCGLLSLLGQLSITRQLLRFFNHLLHSFVLLQIFHNFATLHMGVAKFIWLAFKISTQLCALPPLMWWLHTFWCSHLPFYSLPGQSYKFSHAPGGRGPINSISFRDIDSIMCSTPTNGMIPHILVPLFAFLLHSRGKLQIGRGPKWAWPRKPLSSWSTMQTLREVFLGTY